MIIWLLFLATVIAFGASFIDPAQPYRNRRLRVVGGFFAALTVAAVVLAFLI